MLTATESILDGADPDLAPWMVPMSRAAVYATRGDDDAAIRQLELAFDQGFRSGWRFRFQHWFVFDGLHGHPEFRQLVSRFESDMERQRALAHELLETGA